MSTIERLKVENASLLEEVKRLREENRKVNEDFQKVVAQRDEMWEKVDAIQRKLDQAIAMMEKLVIEKTLPSLPDNGDSLPDSEVHNPDNVTKWGARAGYRLLFKSEVPGGDWWVHPEIDEIEGYDEYSGWMPRMTGVDIRSTYRTKLTPEQLAHARKWAK